MKPDREKVINGLNSIHAVACGLGDDECYLNSIGIKQLQSLINDATELLKAQEPITGETSDGYHTFNELYHHRAVLFSVVVANYPERAWKSKKHHDGTMYDNMFIVGIDTPDGQATYHYDVDPYWDMFKCRVLDNAPEWDGHTPAQAIERIGKLKAQEPRVMTLEEVKMLDSDYYYLESMRSPGKELREIVGTYGLECVTWPSITWARQTMGDSGYGKTWRCWTSRPTDAQREAVKWE